MTGDLAKVMTFNSLYRLERRGLLSVPVVGVAADEWIQCIATIRTLCIDAIHAANSG
jgi:glucose-6-phosphate 1-dehydrogenase